MHARALVWSWWRNSSKVFKHLSPLTKLHKRLGQGQPVHTNREVLRLFFWNRVGWLSYYNHPWPKQHDQSPVPAEVVATALQSAEISTTFLSHLPFGQEHTDSARPARRQRLFWDRLKTHGARFTTVLSYKKMAKNAKLQKRMMRQCLPHMKDHRPYEVWRNATSLKEVLPRQGDYVQGVKV